MLRDTRFGDVWLMRQAALVAALLAVVRFAARIDRPGRLSHALPIIALLVNLALVPWPGHSGAVEPWWILVPAHALHVTAAATWLGSLPVLWWILRREPPQGADILARFSRLALVCMIAIIASGVWVALAHVERWSALLGTAYGAELLAKLVLLVGALLLAVRLRRSLALRVHTGAFDAQAAAHLLKVELSLATAVLLLATALGQTVPARHAAITWLFPFRISLDATWATAGVPQTVVACAVLGIAAAAFGVWRFQRGARRSTIVALALAAVSVDVVLHTLSVPAYPDTYRKPSVPYQTISVSNGIELFAQHCTDCHGASAHGDGPQARALVLPPADLTEPHTALHTAGDIFWWLTHGKPPGVMPGFAGQLSEDDRWDVINFLRTLSFGYQARILTERVVPEAPWLPAVDFSFQTADGASGTLKDFRSRTAVLLVFYRLPDSAMRLAQLAAARERLRQDNIQLLCVPMEPAVAPATASLPIVIEGAEETARTYALFRRTLSNADPRDAAPMPAHMEMLVDRFGYIRARWIPAEGEGWTRLDRLLAQAAALAREPQVRRAPEDHVH
jgi:putative copper export protein/mono/diheme cytochrome c family protein